MPAARELLVGDDDAQRFARHVARPWFTLPNFFGVVGIVKSLLVLYVLLYCQLVSAGTQKKVYSEKTSGQCSDGGGSSITSIAECEQVAVGLGWSDVVVDSGYTGS